MIGKKITVIQDLNGKKIQFIFDHDKNAIDSSKNDLLVAIKQILYSFSNKLKGVRFENEGLVDKKDKRMPSPQNAGSHPSKFEKEGLDYQLNQKSLNYQERLSPFMVNRVLTS